MKILSFKLKKVSFAKKICKLFKKMLQIKLGQFLLYLNMW